MAAPTTTAWAALVRLTRCLIVRPRCVYHFRGRMRVPLSARRSIRTSPGACGFGGPRAGECAGV
eukprot:11088365-Alexandrium_andersonii.AAC.1